MKHPNIYAILRAWNRPGICEKVESLLTLKQIHHVILVVNEGQDAETAPKAQQVFHDHPVTVLPLQEFSWAGSLNTAMCTIQEQEYLALCISLEVDLDEAILDSMIKAACMPQTSCAYVLFQERIEPSYRVPRNTCCLWKSAALFDEACDSFGGMEDYDLALRLYCEKEIIPRCAGNVILHIPETVDFPQKLLREERAMTVLQERYDAEKAMAFKKTIAAQYTLHSVS